jgi:hypothetical protein
MHGIHTNVSDEKKKMTRLGGWSMAKDAMLGGRGNWSPVAMGRMSITDEAYLKGP